MSKNKGTLVSSTIRPISTNSYIATAVANELLGGYHSVNTYVDRDAIPTSRREFGMLVYILSADEFYQLKTINSANLFDNLNWTLVTFSGGGSSTEWLDSVISRSGTPPITPSVGDRYLVVGGSGIWTTFNDLVVEWNGLSYDLTVPTQGTTVRVDNESNSLYAYLNGSYPSGTWTKQDFVLDPFEPLWNIESSKTINVGTDSQYLIYGDLNVDGIVNNSGKVVVLNGVITGSGSINLIGSGTISTYNTLVDIYGGTGVSIDVTSLTTRTISSDILAGTGISLSNFGNSLVISTLPSPTPSTSNKYIIGSSETITVPDYEEYWVYGDLTVFGTLDIGTYGKVVVANGAFIAATGSVVNNMGNVEVYDLLTVADDNLKVDITEIKFGTSGRILFESEMKYIPLTGTYARVITESNNLVYSTSSAYLTSTASLGFDNYFGISTDDPLKKLHIRGSGILIDGQPEQLLSLGDPNYSRFVVDTSTSNVESILQFRNDQGIVLHSSAEIVGGFRYPSLSVGSISSNKILNVSDYYGNNYLSIGATGTFMIGTISEHLWIGTSTNGFDEYLVRDKGTGVLKTRNSGWGNDCLMFQYMSDTNRLLGIGVTGPNIDSKVHISTDGTIPGTSSYIDSAFKIEVKGASAVSNKVYSGYFTGGEGVYIDKLEIDSLISQKINFKDELVGFASSTNSTPFDLWTYSLATASMVKIEAEINAIQDTSGISALYSSTLGVIARDNMGTVYQVGSIDKTLKSPYFTSADVGLTFTGANISLQANGDATKNINWIFNISYTELSA